jgi:hypothetical protein
MADRFYINTTNLVTFAAGERPSADKFNAVNKYFSRGLTSLSRIIGDAHDNGVPHNFLGTAAEENYRRYLTNPWNRSNDPKNERPLDITNLARLIGPASNLNPKYLLRKTPLSDREVQETIPSGVNEYYFNFKHSEFRGLEEPDDSTTTYINSSLPFTDSGAGNNKFSVDASNSSIRFEKPLEEAIIVKYSIALSDTIEGGPNYVDAEFNVIPDPNEPVTGANRLNIVEELDGSYTITLPTLLHQQSGLVNLADSNLGSDEPNAGAQLRVPAWMQGLQPEQELPQGTIYLKNRTTGETYIDAVYTLIGKTEIKVSNVELCLDNAEDYCLISVGTDITTSIDDLRNKTFLHKHDGRFGESRISIYDLKDIFKFAPPSGFYQASELNWNVIPQYLHRDGWQAGEDLINGENAMRGSLMMGSSSFNPLTSTTVLGNNSQAILFAGTICSIQKINNNLKIKNISEGIDLEADDIFSGSRINRVQVSESAQINVEGNVNFFSNLNNVSLNVNNQVLTINDELKSSDPDIYGPIVDSIPFQGNNFLEIYNKELRGVEGVKTEEMPIGRIGATLNNFSLQNESDPTSGVGADYMFLTTGASGNAYWYENRQEINNEGPDAGYFTISKTIETNAGGSGKLQFQVNAVAAKNKLNAYYKYCISKSYTAASGEKVIVWDRDFDQSLTDPNPGASIHSPAITTELKIVRGVNLMQLDYSPNIMYKSVFFVEVESDYHSGEIDGYFNSTSIPTVLSSSHEPDIIIDYSNEGIINDIFNSVQIKQVYINGVDQNVTGSSSSITILATSANSIMKIEETIINGYAFLKIEKI